jgi:Tol biopolymer transport system component
VKALYCFGEVVVFDRATLAVRLTAQRAAIAAVVVLAAPVGCGGSAGVHNAGIVWGCRPFSAGSCPGSRGIVYVIEGANVDGSGRHVVATDFGDSEGDPAWSRDGHALAFYVRNSDDVKIHVLWPKTKAHRVLASDWRSPPVSRRVTAYLFEPSWAPDGDHLAVSDYWNFGANATIRIVSVSTRRWTSLTRPSSHRTDSEPAWSPDGPTIAFVRQQNWETPGIFLIGRDGRGLRRLTRGWSPSWSPDSRYIAFAWGGSIYRIGADGRGRSRIAGGVDASHVSWSPDGRKLLYTTEVRGEGEPTDVWIMNRDGTDRVRVLRKATMSGSQRVAWQPG